MADTATESLTAGSNSQKMDALVVQRVGQPRLEGITMGRTYFGRALWIPFVLKATWGGASNTWALLDDSTFRDPTVFDTISTTSALVNINFPSTQLYTVGGCVIQPGPALLGAYEAGASVTRTQFAITFRANGASTANPQTLQALSDDNWYGMALMVPRSHT